MNIGKSSVLVLIEALLQKIDKGHKSDQVKGERDKWMIVVNAGEISVCLDGLEAQENVSIGEIQRRAEEVPAEEIKSRNSLLHIRFHHKALRDNFMKQRGLNSSHQSSSSPMTS